MKTLGIVSLIFKELKYRKNKFKVFMVSIVIGVISLLLFATLNDGVVTYLQEMMNQNPEYKEITISSSSTEESREIVEFAKTIPYVSDVYEYMQLIGADTFEIDGTEYMPMEEIKGLNTAEDDLGNNDFIVCGRGFQKKDEKKALIDEYALLSLGIKDYNDILGKKVKIRRGEKEVEVQIVGVYTIDVSVDKENTGSLFYDEKNRLDIGVSPVILTYDSAKQLENKEDESISYIKLLADSVYHVEQIYNQLIEKNVPVYAEITDINKAIENIDIIREILYMVAIILLIIAILNMLNAQYDVIADNRKWYYILMVIGYRKKQIVGIVSAEIAFLTFKAVAISGIIMYAIIILLNNIVFGTLGITKIFSYPLATFLKLGWLLIVSVVMTSIALAFFILAEKRNDIEHI